MPDYTKERKSKRIRVCPKCGRKGRFSQPYTTHKGVRSTWEMYVHSSVIQMGMFESVRDYCTTDVQRLKVRS